MGISGSQLAPNQARSNIGRSGATRSGYYFPNVIVTINGTDRSSLVYTGTLEITDALNEAPNQCRFSMNATAVTVTAGHPVEIALGSANATQRIFAGTIIQVNKIKFEETMWRYEIEAVDYSWLLDRRLIATTYTGWPAADIARDIITTYVPGLTANHVPQGLVTIASFPLQNVRPSTALTRLAVLASAKWYIDYDKDLHFYASETFQSPAALTDSSANYRAFRYATDLRQVRTRVYVEGKRTTCPLAVQTTGMPSTAGAYYIPLETADPFLPVGGSGTARIGTERFSYSTSISNGATGGNSPNATTTSADAAIADTTISVTSVSGFSTSRWARVGEQLIFFGGTQGSPAQLTLIPSSGIGSIQAPIKSGTQVTELSTLGFTTALSESHGQGDDVVMYVVSNDAAAQATLAGLEGSDGIHEHIVQDGRYSSAGATERATVELSTFSTTTGVVSYTTRDPNTRSGLLISVTVTGATTGSYLIQEVRIYGFDQTAPRASKQRRSGAFPLRDVTASPVRFTDLVDLLTSQEQGEV